MERGRTNPWPIVLGFPLGILAAVTAHYAIRLPVIYGDLLADFPEVRVPFAIHDLARSVNLLAIVTGIAAILFLAGSLLTFVRRGWTLSLLRKCYISAYILFWFYAHVVFEVSGLILQENIKINGMDPNAVRVFFWRYECLWPAVCAIAVLAVLHVLSWRRRVIALYAGESDDAPAPGDRIVENLRTHGRDPRYRKSIFSSTSLHVLVIIILPWLLSLRGCVEDYRIQKGSGQPVVAVVKIVKPKKEKKKRFVVNPNSAILFHPPDLDDTELMKQVEQETQLTYQADPNRVVGALGSGGGKKGGWPDGMDNAKVRFIRLEYNGPGWDDGMDEASRADRNFLEAFKQLTGFNVARESESHPIALLRKYRKGFAPPFVYMTGHGDINLTANDVLVLRDYLLDGGMLFADCGSPQWDRNFRNFAQALFPGNPLLVISDDDPLFQLPYLFPQGAPPLWHHGGYRAMGIKHKGRWVVFYHPGDINDAWKTGHSGMSPQLAKGAIEMGVNIVYYSFTHYLELTRKYRK